MIVVVLSNYKRNIAGKLSRYLTEVSSGVFVGGKVTPRIIAKATKIMTDDVDLGGYTIISSTNTEPYFSFVSVGTCKHKMEDFDGLELVSRIKPKM